MLVQLPVPGLWFCISNEKGVLPLRFSPEILELLRKIVLLLCRKYGFNGLTKDYYDKRNEEGQFAKSGTSGTSSAKEEGEQQPAQNSIKASSRPKGAQTPAGEKMLDLFCAKNIKQNQGKQKQHLTPQAARDATEREQEKNPGKKVTPKSYFTKKFQSVEATTLDRIRKGNFDEIVGRHNSTRFQVVFGDVVGRAYNRDTGEFEASHTVETVYSKADGYHMWPVPDDRKGR